MCTAGRLYSTSVVTSALWWRPWTAVGTELHLRSDHEPPISIHTGVWRRAVAGGSRNVVTAAVFAELLEGTYWALDRDGNELVCVDIRGGELASIDLRG